MSEDGNTFKVAKLSGKLGEDFAIWKMRMQAVLVGKDAWSAVGPLEESIDEEAPAQRTRKKSKAIMIIVKHWKIRP